MFSSVKEKIYSVVHEGIDLNQTVLRKISVNQQIPGIKKQNDKSAACINEYAGAELLTKYQEYWKELHEEAEKNAQLAENIDGTLLKLMSSVNIQLNTIVILNNLLSSLPQLTSKVENCIEHIKELEVLSRTVEKDLIHFEDVIEVCDFKHRQSEHNVQLTMYKKQKLDEFQKNWAVLAKQQAEAAKEIEKQQRNALQEKQRAAHNAFLKDIDMYKAQGILPKNREEMIPKEKESLEEIHLNTDNSELDDFLNT